MWIGAEIDCEDKSRNTALHIAARCGHELIITALIKHGANTAKLVTIDILPPVFSSHWIYSVLLLWEAQIIWWLEMFKLKKTIFQPFFVSSCYLSHLSLHVLWWLAFSASHHFRRGIHGMFPLHLAALSGFSDCCRKLLSSGTYMLTLFLLFESPSWHPNGCWLHICTGFDIDTPDDFGRTCLHAAAAGGWVIVPAKGLTVSFLSLSSDITHTIVLFFCLLSTFSVWSN